jgi:hypothetical protein
VARPLKHARDWAGEKKKAGPAGLRGGRKGKEREMGRPKKKEGEIVNKKCKLKMLLNFEFKI